MTGIFLYNTLARAKEELTPREPGKVSLYVCGVTPYDSLHVGHARAFTVYDVLRRVRACMAARASSCCCPESGATISSQFGTRSHVSANSCA